MMWSIVASVAFAVLPPAAGLSEQEMRQGFVSLFDGKGLAGWQGATEDVSTGGSSMTMAVKKSAGIHRTEWACRPATSLAFDE
jgi:hypothetical protein